MKCSLVSLVQPSLFCSFSAGNGSIGVVDLEISSSSQSEPALIDLCEDEDESKPPEDFQSGPRLDLEKQVAAVRWTNLKSGAKTALTATKFETAFE